MKFAVFAANSDRAAILLEESGDHIEDRGLAGAVGADQPRISPCRSEKLTLLVTCRPPKCFCRPSTTRIGSPIAGRSVSRGAATTSKPVPLLFRRFVP